MTPENREQILRAFLGIYWLRPENALWRALNVLAMDGIDLPTPSLDSSCGDGLFSFIRAGGRLNPEFDVYSGVASVAGFNKNVDIYDAVSEDYAPVIATAPAYRMSVGIDWKQNLLTKADALKFYERTFVHDNNTAFTFPDESFASIFSNSSYWIENLPLHLRELARILRSGGTAVLVVMNRKTLDYRLEHLKQWFGAEWLSLIDRGRSQNYKGLRTEQEWDKELEKAGFRIANKIPGVTWTHSYLEYVGLRPLSPVMIDIARSLQLADRARIKEDWINSWLQLLKPFNRIDFDLGHKMPAVENIYILQRR